MVAGSNPVQGSSSVVVVVVVFSSTVCFRSIDCLPVGQGEVPEARGTHDVVSHASMLRLSPWKQPKSGALIGQDGGVHCMYAKCKPSYRKQALDQVFLLQLFRESIRRAPCSPSL